MTELLGFDVDTENPELAKIIKAALPDAPCRLGNRARPGVFLYFWGGGGEVPSMKFVNEREETIFEVLGKGRQFVAPPSMRKSGLPYEMTGEDDFPALMDLPEINQEDIDRVVEAVRAAGFFIERKGSGYCDKPTPEELKAYVDLINLPDVVEDVRRYLENDAPISVEGQRGHDNARNVWHRCVDLGCPPDRVVGLMWAYWDSRNCPPWEDEDALEAELSGLIHSRRSPIGSRNEKAFLERTWEDPFNAQERVEYEEAERKKAARFDLEPLSEVLEKYETTEEEWAVDRLLPAAGVAVIFGKPGAFKSFIALDIALHIAGGGAWCGRDTRQGSVIYVAAEGVAGVRKRLAGHFKFYGEMGTQRDAPFYLVKEAPNLGAEVGDYPALVKAVEAQGVVPSVITIDTLAQTLEETTRTGRGCSISSPTRRSSRRTSIALSSSSTTSGSRTRSECEGIPACTAASTPSCVRTEKSFACAPRLSSPR